MSQKNAYINSAKRNQKILVTNEFKQAIGYKNRLQSLKIDTCYIDEYWSAVCNGLLNIYDNKESFSKFGQNKVIMNTMIGDPVRNVYGQFKNLINFEQEDDLLEEWFGNFRINVPKFNTSGQRLGHIYVANLILGILKKEDLDIISINEVGGGFGGLARILGKRIKAETYTIIDLWQLLPLQRAYLNLTTDEKFTDYEFVPVQDNFTVREANVFISNWALTESARQMQQYVVDSGFFGAQHVFIACQSTNTNHKHGKYLHDYLTTNSHLKLSLEGAMSDSKLFYLKV